MIESLKLAHCQTGVAVPGKPLAALPQGGNACLFVKGKGLTLATSFELGGLNLSLVGDSGDEMVVLGVDVPHGAEPGPREFRALVGGQPAGAVPAVEVTALSVSKFGSDTGGWGTPSSPWQTLQKAFVHASSGDTVRLHSSLALVSSTQVDLPAGVTLDGGGFTLNGAGMSADPPAFFRARAGSALKDLELTGFPSAALRIHEGLVSLTDVVFSNNWQGISLGLPGRLIARGTAPGKCRFVDTIQRAVYLFNGTQATDQAIFEDCEFVRSGESALWAEFGASIQLHRCLVSGNVKSSSVGGGVFLLHNTSLTSVDTVYENNGPGSIVARMTSDGSKLVPPKWISVTGGSIQGGDRGVDLIGVEEARFTDVRVEETSHAAYHIQGPGKVVIEGTKPDTCVVQGLGDAALYASDWNGVPSVEVSQCTFRKARFGAIAVGNAVLSLSGVTLEGIGHPGDEGIGAALKLHDQATLLVSGGTIRENLHAGVLLEGGKQATLHGVDLFQNGTGLPDGDSLGDGVRVQGAASVSLNAVKLHNHPRGAGLRLVSGGAVVVSDTSLEKNLRGVVDLRASGSLSLDTVTLNKQAREGLFSSNSSGNLTLLGGVFSGNNASGDAALADVVLAREAGGPPASFGAVSFDGQPCNAAGTLCAAAASVQVGTKVYLRNDGSGCVAW